MKKALLFAALILTALLHAQEAGKDFYVPDFKWTIKIPEGFQPENAKDWKEMQDRGVDAIEKTYEVDTDSIMVPNHTIFVIKKGMMNYMEASHQEFNPEVDGSYEETNNLLVELMKETFKSQMPDAKVLALHFTEVVGSLTFYRNDITVTYPNGWVLYVHSYSRLFGTKDFTLNIIYLNKKDGDKMLEAWKASKFD